MPFSRAAAAACRPEPEAARKGTGMRVLLIEDDSATAQSIELMLSLQRGRAVDRTPTRGYAATREGAMGGVREELTAGRRRRKSPADLRLCRRGPHPRQ